MTLLEQVKQFPEMPGIYLFYNATGDLVYVGKATSLRDRVRSYFSVPRTIRPIEEQFHEVVRIDYRPTDSALEAIILESIFIKKYQPKYNILGKDDKSWNYIVITKEQFPQVIPVREHDLKQKLEIRNLKLGLVFGPYPGLNTRAAMKILRRLFRFSTCQNAPKGRSCFYYQIEQCLGICIGEITPTEYRRKVIRPLILFLRGQKKRLVNDLEKQMKRAAKGHDFEEAARLRDQIASLQRIQDIALLNRDFVDNEKLETRNWKLGIKKIEGYDISNLGPTGMVGSLVVFVHGEPDKSQYRKFRIRTVPGQSDVDCLEEVIRRRLKHADRKLEIRNWKLGIDVWPLPDLFLIDGGKPQVNRVQKILHELQIMLPVVGIAKGPRRKKNEFVIGEISKYRNSELIQWIYTHQSLLIRVRDEAHRFAVAYQRQTRKL